MSEINFKKMLPLYGKWKVAENGATVNFLPQDGETSSHGLILLGKSVDDGIIECDVRFSDANPNCGAFVVFRANGQESFFGAGLGGWENAYTLIEGRHLSPTRISTAGNISNIESDREYKIRIALNGQRVQVFVDDVRVINHSRLTSTGGTGIGLFAFRGSGEVSFGPLKTDDRRPNAFVAMQFSEPYNEVYKDAIRPLVEEIGYDVVRVDEISQPGIILNDIWSHLTEASVVIAEVTEANPNVYYEIGVAHALNKPTVLLAQKGTKLPFDIGPHRCIFYENTIGGRSRLLSSLRSTLGHVLGISVVH